MPKYSLIVLIVRYRGHSQRAVRYSVANGRRVCLVLQTTFQRKFLQVFQVNIYSALSSIMHLRHPGMHIAVDR